MPDIWDYFGKLHNTVTSCSAWPSFQQQILLQTQMLDSETKTSFSLWLTYTLQVKIFSPRLILIFLSPLCLLAQIHE